MDLPPGFRFHPTDEELITHYLSKKIADCDFSAITIGEVDMNKVEPWDLPWMAKVGEREWYFFCVKDKKYPTGSRTNRATAAGYWKATGKDKEIFRGQTLVGTKKTLVFYKGRAPKGEKSNWVAHEYNMPNSTQNNWVLSRVFQKTSGGKKVHISELIRMHPSTPPPLMDSNPPPYPYHNTKTEPVDSESGLVPCFSSPNVPGSYWWGPFSQILDRSSGTGRRIPGFVTPNESSIFGDMVGQTTNHECKKEGEILASVSQETAFSTDNSNLEVENISFDARGLTLVSVGSLDLDTLWGY